MSSKEMQMQWMLQMIEAWTLSHPWKYTSDKKEGKITRIFFPEKEGQQKIQVCVSYRVLTKVRNKLK